LARPRIVVLHGWTLNTAELSWHELQVLGDLTVHERASRELVACRAAGVEIVLT
jgi:glycerate dehydrogenase